MYRRFVERSRVRSSAVGSSGSGSPRVRVGSAAAGRFDAAAPSARRAKYGLKTAGTAILLLLAFLILFSPGRVAALAPDLDEREPDATIGVVYADGRQMEDVSLYRLESGSRELFISAYDLARIFRATKFWHSGARKLVLRIDIHRFMFTLDTRVVVVDDTPVLMRMPVRYENGSVMIPLEFIGEVLANASEDDIDLDEKRLVLTIGAPSYNVTDIEFVSDGEGTRVVLDLTEELLYHVDSESPGLLRLKIYGGRLNPLKFTIPKGEGLFNRVRAEQTERDAYLFFDVKQTAARFRVEFEGYGGAQGEGRQLAIYIEKGELPEIPAVDYAGKRMVEILDDVSRERRQVPVRIVAVDPGHGGIDNGRVGPSGVREKEINYEISMLLKQHLIDDLGMEVIMTRESDELIPLDRRVETANIAEADLFISIHCNGWFDSDAGGFEVFFLSPARTEEETRQAREENSSVRFENSGLGAEQLDDLNFILWDMVQNEFINESSGLAEFIQRELDENLDIRNRGVKQAGFKVLKGLNMPAVLIEVAFLSNPEEEKLLHDEGFRRDVVRGIVDGVRRYQLSRAAAGLVRD